MKKHFLIAAPIMLAVLIGGYFGYEYLKEKPPAFLVTLLTAQKPPPPLPLGDEAPIRLPEGFSATIFARDIPGARVMARDPKGAMLVCLTKEGKVIALPNLDGDGRADQVLPVLEGLNQPHGLAVICPNTGFTSTDQDSCKLYVAETGALKSYAYDADTYTARYLETITTFPTGDGHYTRTILQHPDGRLLVSVGSSCNVCREQNVQRASIQAINLETKEKTTFAAGLRNTVFMALNPVSGELWGTDNGRDVIGDDIPPDEINILQEGKNYGWPYCYGKNVKDTDFDSKSTNSCSASKPSHIDLPAHSAALGLAFIPEEGWPEEWRHDLLVAYHGSWNRSEPTGYKVVRINMDQNGQNPEQNAFSDFITGFLAPGADEDAAIGRPVGILAEPGGTVYVSDDRAGAIYRITLDEQP